MIQMRPTLPPIEIRELQGVHELGKVEGLERAVWGEDEACESADLLLAIQHEGGLIAGALAPGAELVGFVFAFPTHDPRVQHSHRLAVLEGWRSSGLGARLKWFQRSWSLERGIELIRWTYDPLRAINADLNIRRLAASSGIYYENYYGDMPGINAGTPSDRLLVEWRLNDPRVAANALSAPADPGFPLATAANPRKHSQGESSSFESPGAPMLDLETPQIRLDLPIDFGALLATNRPLALEWRLNLRLILEHYFERGYRITNFTRTGGPAYILEKAS
jgi:chorismate synthase